VEQKVLAPGVQHGQHAGLGTQVFRIRGHLEQRLGGGPQEQVVDDPRIGQCDRVTRRGRGRTSTSSSVIMTFTPSAALAAIARSSRSGASGSSSRRWDWIPTASRRTQAAFSSRMRRIVLSRFSGCSLP
jgi:hypothetical protein